MGRPARGALRAGLVEQALAGGAQQPVRGDVVVPRREGAADGGGVHRVVDERELDERRGLGGLRPAVGRGEGGERVLAPSRVPVAERGDRGLLAGGTNDLQSHVVSRRVVICRSIGRGMARLERVR